MASQALALPGSSSLNAFPGSIAQSSDLAKMEPKLLSLFIKASVPTDKIDELAKAGVSGCSLFGAMTSDRAEMIEFIKAVTGNDVAARPLEMRPRCRILTVWEACRASAEVELKHQAERSLQALPPQVVQGDFEIAKAALEKLEGYELPKHWLPSKAYFERKLSHVETFYQAEPLTTVTNISQADANELQTLQLESASVTFKIQKKEFGVPMPMTSKDLRTRFRVMASCWIKAKMRYQANRSCSRSSWSTSRATSTSCSGPRAGCWSRWALTRSPSLAPRSTTSWPMTRASGRAWPSS